MERPTYRIIDANFNRAREACRLIEEYCRFVLNNESLTTTIKQLRHELCGQISKLDSKKLLANRDTLGDVGIGQKLQKQMQRVDLADSLTAAFKRLPEALRALTETIKTINPEIAESVEQLRYRSYTLEKNVAIFACAIEKYSKVRLYVVLTSDLPAEILHLTNKCIAGGADCIQMRAKNMHADQMFATACEMVRLCRDNGVISIINDRSDIAIAAGADGIHLGQNDLPLPDAKALVNKPMIFGKSTHNMEQLKKAVDDMPTYVGLGPVYPTGTKPSAESVGLEYVSQAVEYLKDKSIDHVAIGGITTSNLTDVLAAGAKAIAVCSAITQAPDPKKACIDFKQKITDF